MSFEPTDSVDFCEQLAFPPREEVHREWSCGEVERWSDPETVAADLEKCVDWIRKSMEAAEAEREVHIRSICAYQVAIQKRLGDDCLWLFGGRAGAEG